MTMTQQINNRIIVTKTPNNSQRREDNAEIVLKRQLRRAKILMNSQIRMQRQRSHADVHVDQGQKRMMLKIKMRVTSKNNRTRIDQPEEHVLNLQHERLLITLMT